MLKRHALPAVVVSHTGTFEPAPIVIPLLTTGQAAALLGISPRTMENRRSTGLDFIRYCKVGRSVRYDPRDIAAYVNARRFDNTSAADVHHAYTDEMAA